MLMASQSWEDTCTSNPDGGLYGEETCPSSSPDEPIGDPGGSGLPGGGGPTPLDPPVDSDTGPLTPCQQTNQAVELIVNSKLPELWSKCLNGNEHGFLVYRDSNGVLQTTSIYTDGLQSSITHRPSDHNITWSDVEAVVHCHPSGNITDGSMALDIEMLDDIASLSGNTRIRLIATNSTGQNMKQLVSCPTSSD
ncbi:hypothetical protein [Parvularcula marina]|uniref:hypothetical protein n=1 Tax=Parvularcula marina TaxID=2292771 RepID=UPI001314EC0F|nr:hypothetical protein [Parvularcula marina]